MTTFSFYLNDFKIVETSLLNVTAVHVCMSARARVYMNVGLRRARNGKRWHSVDFHGLL